MERANYLLPYHSWIYASGPIWSYYCMEITSDSNCPSGILFYPIFCWTGRWSEREHLRACTVTFFRLAFTCQPVSALSGLFSFLPRMAAILEVHLLQTDTHFMSYSPAFCQSRGRSAVHCGSVYQQLQWLDYHQLLDYFCRVTFECLLDIYPVSFQVPAPARRILLGCIFQFSFRKFACLHCTISKWPKQSWLQQKQLLYICSQQEWATDSHWRREYGRRICQRVEHLPRD